MSTASAPSPAAGRPTLAVASRFAFRELRGGLKGFYIFLACIALGVMTIAGVGSLSRALTEGIASEGQSILGGDLAFAIVQRQVNDDERRFLETARSLSEVATLRAMGRVEESATQTLVELKAVDATYPLYGTLALEDGGDFRPRLEKTDGLWGALAEATLLARLDRKVGDTISLGRTSVRITGVIKSEPDRLSGRAVFGPRLLISEKALPDTGLIRPGSLVTWVYRVRLNDTGIASNEAIARFTESAKAAFPEAGWRIRSRTEAAPGLTRNIARFAQFLTLVGLTALVVGGVGVANAVRAHLDGRREVIATYRCLGATAGFVFAVYLIQILTLAGIGIVIGLIAGAAIPFIAGAFLAQLLPFTAAIGVYPQELALATVYGVLTTLAFALWPLGHAGEVPPTALFRDRAGSSRRWPRAPYIVATAIAVAALAAIAIVLADDPRIAIVYTIATVAIFIVLRGVAIAIMALARRLPRARSTVLRLAVGNIHRKGALTPTVVLSLGLGLALIVTLSLIDGNLRHQITSNLPEQAPSFFFLDIQSAEVPAFEALIAKSAPDGKLQRVPMLRGRITALQGVPADQLKGTPAAAWVLRGDRGLTYSAELPANSTLEAGEWWPKDYSGPPLVSFAAELAGELGLSIGDTVSVNVLGREITAKIANLRGVEWESLAINFVMVFSPNTFAGAPHPHLATLTFADGGSPEREIAVLKDVAKDFPTVTAIRVKDALSTINDLLSQLAIAIRAAASITLIASVLVLGGALASSHRHRIYDAVILKTLGATRSTLITAFGLEYLLIGLATALFGVFAGIAAAWAVVARVMNLPFIVLPEVALVAALGAMTLSLVFGLVGTWRVLGEKPAPALRNQ